MISLTLSCQKEEIFESDNQKAKIIGTVELQEALEVLNNLEISRKNNSKAEEVPFVVPVTEEITQEEITNSSQMLIVIPAKAEFAGKNNRILMLKINEKIETIVFSMYGAKDPITHQFSGEILITDINGVFNSGFTVKNGVITANLIIKKTNHDKSKSHDKSGGTYCEFHNDGDPMCAFQDNQFEVHVEGPSHTWPGYVSLLTMYPGDISGGGDSDGGMTWNYGGAGPSSTQPVDNPIEDKIDDDDLEDCLSFVLDTIRIQTHLHGIGKVIETFGGNNENFNWVVQSGSLSGQTGMTSTNYNVLDKSTTSTFDSQGFPHATDLSWIRTLLHEAGHAYVVSVTNFEGLSVEKRNDYLGDHWLIAYISDGHPFLAETYISSIADILQEYGQYKGYTADRCFYDDLAWGGLTDWEKLDENGDVVLDSDGNKEYEETPWFLAEFPDPADRKRVKDIIAAELTGKDTNGVTNDQEGQNADC